MNDNFFAAGCQTINYECGATCSITWKEPVEGTEFNLDF